MSDLPTREEAKVWIDEFVNYGSDRIEPFSHMIQAYADGTLMTREEWAENLDINAITERWYNTKYGPNQWKHVDFEPTRQALSKHVADIVAALGGTDEPQ